MSLELLNTEKTEGDQTHIYPTSIKFEPGSMNVLLGATRSGKTSLMRLMAGLDIPTRGKILVNGQDVTGVPVQERKLAMVYQQFINYPSMTVYDNIASPLRIMSLDKNTIDEKVRSIAELLKIDNELHRKPLELSGGQQQRCALARALVKDSELVLLDEPLANLDYKLREELRAEIPKLFAASGAIFVYATTEPTEALLLGGNTATLHEGKVQQYGPTSEVFRNPANQTSAQVFSDPPMNFLTLDKHGDQLNYAGDQSITCPPQFAHLPDGIYQAGFRANHLLIDAPNEPALQFDCQVTVTEMTGSESFIHLAHGDDSDIEKNWIALVHGIHDLANGSPLRTHLKLSSLYLFDQNQQWVASGQTHTKANMQPVNQEDTDG